MKVLIAVVDDLLVFARSALFGSQSVVLQDSKEIVLPKKTYKDIPEEAVVKTNHEPKKQFVSEALLHAGEQYYVGTVDALLYADPAIVFDNVVHTLAYAQSVRLLQMQGRWAQVRIAEKVGWVLKDVLCSAARDVFPDFSSDEIYSSEHEQTAKLRACIADEFGGARGEFSLTPEEYVHYKLQQKKRTIHWGDERSRHAGTWQRKLKGKSGIYNHIHPKTDAVMEYVIDDVGHLSFVEAVFPDNSIKVSEILSEGVSEYRERTLVSEEWKELRPVFITVA